MDALKQTPPHPDGSISPVEKMRQNHQYILKTNLVNGTFSNLLPRISQFKSENPLLNLQQLPYVLALTDLEQVCIFDPEKKQFRGPTNLELQQIKSQDTTLQKYRPLDFDHFDKLNQILDR